MNESRNNKIPYETTSKIRNAINNSATTEKIKLDNGENSQIYSNKLKKAKKINDKANNMKVRDNKKEGDLNLVSFNKKNNENKKKSIIAHFLNKYTYIFLFISITIIGGIIFFKFYLIKEKGKGINKIYNSEELNLKKDHIIQIMFYFYIKVIK